MPKSDSYTGRLDGFQALYDNNLYSPNYNGGISFTNSYFTSSSGIDKDGAFYVIAHKVTETITINASGQGGNGSGFDYVSNIVSSIKFGSNFLDANGSRGIDVIQRRLTSFLISESVPPCGQKNMTLQEKRIQMLLLVDRWKASGMSQADFARAHQVNLAKFRYWINAQRKGTIESTPAFIELNGFSHQDISIRYPNGVELVLPAQTPVVVLRSLINL